MSDQSYLDKKYFINQHVYNCPFCKRNNVQYVILNVIELNWRKDKPSYAYFIICSSCGNISLHITNEDLNPERLDWQPKTIYRINELPKELDEIFFFSWPSSFFVMDKRIPEDLRQLLSEAQDCAKYNFLTGASACARKIIYELAVKEGAEGDNYDERIKSLKRIKPEIDSTYFDTLLTIQQTTSDMVHEQSYDGWNSKHLKLILFSLVEILNEIYVIPKERDEKRDALLKLRGEILESKKISGEEK